MPKVFLTADTLKEWFEYKEGNLFWKQNPSNNKIENLREASKKQNSYNSKLFKHNKSGHRGISWSKRDGKWVVRYKTEEKYIYGGSFINMYEAILCRQKLEKKGGV